MATNPPENLRRTYGDLRAPGGAHLWLNGKCSFCHSTYKNGVREDAIDKGGVRRFQEKDTSLICDFCISDREDTLLPIERRREAFHKLLNFELETQTAEGRLADPPP